MNEPRFWNDFLERVPFCTNLLRHFEQIRTELLHFIEAQNPLRDYPQISYLNPQTQKQEESLYENYWRAFPLSSFNDAFVELSKDSLGYEMQPYIQWTRSQCPFTTSLISDLEQQENLSNVFVSRLLPGSHIKPHHGWSFIYLRIQLGLKCDPECKITVGDETQTWTEGKLLAFKDGGKYPHSVIHNGTSERIILSFDLRLIYLKKFIPEIF